MSSIQADQTVDTCKRWCKKEKVYVTVPRPLIVKAYNCNMGGVDLADCLLAVCPHRYRTNKWTGRFISHMFDLATTNAWLHFKNDELKKGVPVKKIQQLRSSKMDIAEAIINAYVETSSDCDSDDEDEQPPFKRSKVTVPLPTKETRRHGSLHMPAVGESQKRCRRPGCTQKKHLRA